MYIYIHHIYISKPHRASRSGAAQHVLLCAELTPDFVPGSIGGFQDWVGAPHQRRPSAEEGGQGAGGTCWPPRQPSPKQSVRSSDEGQALVQCRRSVSMLCCDHTFSPRGLGGLLGLVRNCVLQGCVACTPGESSKSTLLCLTASPTRRIASFSYDNLPCSIL